MSVTVTMPSAMAGAAEAAVQRWLVAVGDEVTAGQPLVEIETEKAVFEVEAEAAGTIAQILAAEGTQISVGAPIAVIAEPGEDAASIAAPTPPAGADELAGQSAPEGSAPASVGPDRAASATSEGASSSAEQDGHSARIFATPIVRKLARERGLDLGTVRGTGPNGRIVRRDLDALPAEAKERAVATAASLDGDAPFEDIPLTPMRRAIARRLTESVTTIPQFTVNAECRVDALIALRTQINEAQAAREADPVSLGDLVLIAVGAALAAVPEANAIWTENAIRRFGRADVGVAVALDGGLVTPVVRGVDRLRVTELSTAVRDIAQRAREGRLRQDELGGGSFAVSNLGMFGTRSFTAIINPPHSGILAVGAAERRAMVDEDGALTAATVMSVTLTADHRVVDGALAARWLNAFRGFIEHPVTMLV